MGSKLTFWVMVGVASIIFIYLFKLVAANQPSQGLRDFAASI